MSSSESLQLIVISKDKQHYTKVFRVKGYTKSYRQRCIVKAVYRGVPFIIGVDLFNDSLVLDRPTYVSFGYDYRFDHSNEPFYVEEANLVTLHPKVRDLIEDSIIKYCSRKLSNLESLSEYTIKINNYLNNPDKFKKRNVEYLHSIFNELLAVDTPQP